MKITDVILEAAADTVDRSTTKSPALSALLKQAYAKYPSSGSDIEAYIRQDVDHQQDTDSTLDRQRNVNNQQGKYIDRLQDVARKQNSKINSIDQENDHLETELNKLGKELDALEKGAKPKEKSKEPEAKTDKTIQPSSGSVGTPAWATLPDQAKPPPAEEPSAMKSTAAQLTAPKPQQDPMAAMTQRIQQGDQSITDKVTGQQSLGFEPTGNVLEPVIPQQQNPKFAAAKANASDVDPRYYADIAKRVAGSPEEFRSAMGGVKEGEQKPGEDYIDPEEADYGPEYQDMVSRVKKLAGLGPLKTVYDPNKRVYRNVPTADQPKK